MRNLSNRIYDAFDSVYAGQKLKEKTKAYLSQKPNRRQLSFARYAAAAACILSVLLGVGGYALYMTPVAAISIDVNPSMEWEVNRLDRVVSVICYNKEAEHVAEKLHLKHRKYDEAITALLTSREMSAYLAEDAAVSISVAAEDEARSIRMQGRAAECAGEHCRNVSCHGGNVSDLQAASEAGVSLGKYEAFLILQELDPSITLNEVSGMCMGEIQTLIRAYQGQEDAEQTDVYHADGRHCRKCMENAGQGNGNAAGTGIENQNGPDSGNAGSQEMENKDSQTETNGSRENGQENDSNKGYRRHRHNHHHG